MEKEKEEDILEKESDDRQILSFYNTHVSQHLIVGISRHPVISKNNIDGGKKKSRDDFNEERC